MYSEIFVPLRCLEIQIHDIKSFLTTSVSVHKKKTDKTLHTRAHITYVKGKSLAHDLLVAVFVLWLPIKDAWQVKLKPLTHCLLKAALFRLSFART